MAGAMPSERTSRACTPVAATQYDAMPSVIKKMGMEEDEGNPSFALFESILMSSMMLRKQTPGAHLPIAATLFAATPSTMAGIGTEENGGNLPVARC